MTANRTAVEELERQIELAQAALSVSEHFATADPATVRDAMILTAQLKDEIVDMQAQLAELERHPTRTQVDHMVLSHEDLTSHRPDTRDAQGSRRK